MKPQFLYSLFPDSFVVFSPFEVTEKAEGFAEGLFCVPMPERGIRPDDIFEQVAPMGHRP